ncbi:MAG: glycosyltransferase family 39 protein [Chloroflexota bacterium]
MRTLRGLILVVIVLLSVGFASSTITFGHEWGDDFAWYIMQAKSIVNGKTDALIETGNFINTRSTMSVGPDAYPWGYPIILIPFIQSQGVDPIILKIPDMLFYASFLLCLYELMKTRLTQTESLIAVSLFAFNPMLIKFQDHILSDIPFLFFSTLTLLLVQQKQSNRLNAIWIGLSVFLTAFLRTTGILLLGSFLLVELFKLWEQRRNHATARRIITDGIIVCSAFALPFLASIILLPNGGESYFSQYSALSLESIRKFTVAYFYLFGEFFGKSTGQTFLYYFIFLLFLFGAWKRKKEDMFFILFSILWMIIHITWPYLQGARFIFPLLPIFIYFAFQGTNAVIETLKHRQEQGRYIFYAFWLLVTAMLLYGSISQAHDNLQRERRIGGPFDPFTKQVYAYVKQKTPSDSVIVFFKPRVMTLMTDHLSIMSTKCDRLLTGDYVVISKKDGSNQQIPPNEISNCNAPLNKVFQNLRFIIYKVDK